MVKVGNYLVLIDTSDKLNAIVHKTVHQKFISNTKYDDVYALDNFIKDLSLMLELFW